MTVISIKTEYITLDAALKLSGAVISGGEAKVLIKDGQIAVNSETCTMRGKKLRTGDRITVGEDEYLIK